PVPSIHKYDGPLQGRAPPGQGRVVAGSRQTAYFSPHPSGRGALVAGRARRSCGEEESFLMTGSKGKEQARELSPMIMYHPAVCPVGKSSLVGFFAELAGVAKLAWQEKVTGWGSVRRHKRVNRQNGPFPTPGLSA